MHGLLTNLVNVNTMHCVATYRLTMSVPGYILATLTVREYHSNFPHEDQLLMDQPAMQLIWSNCRAIISIALAKWIVCASNSQWLATVAII